MAVAFRVGCALAVYFRGLFQISYCEEEVRCCFDIGSGTTKFQVGSVETRTQTLLQIFESKKFQIPIQKDSQQLGFIPDDIEKKISAVLKEEHFRISKLYRCLCIATATEAFRSVSNGREVARRIEKETGINIDFLTQDEEALLGQKALIAEGIIRKEQMPKIITWENGNGSSQIVVTDAEGNPHFWHHRIGKVFAKDCAEKILKDIENPQENHIEALEALIEKHLQNVPSFFTAKLQEPDVIVVGLGAMFTSVCVGLKKRVFTREELKNLIGDFICGKVRIDKKDFLSDVIFIYTFMRYSNIEKIWFPILIGEGSTSGILVDQSRWNFKLKKEFGF